MLKVAGGTSKGLPAIDFLGIASPEGMPLVECGDAGEAAAIERVPAEVGMEGSMGHVDIYDLSGRKVSRAGETRGVCPGIYLRGGKKVLVK